MTSTLTNLENITFDSLTTTTTTAVPISSLSNLLKDKKNKLKKLFENPNNLVTFTEEKSLENVLSSSTIFPQNLLTSSVVVPKNIQTIVSQPAYFTKKPNKFFDWNPYQKINEQIKKKTTIMANKWSILESNQSNLKSTTTPFTMYNIDGNTDKKLEHNYDNINTENLVFFL